MKWQEVAWNGWAKSMRWIRTWDLLTKSPEAWFLWYNVDKGGVTYDGTAKWSNEYDHSWFIRILIPENHLLRKINQIISLDFIYDLVAPYYRRCLSQPGTAGHYRIYSCYSVFQLSWKVWFLLSTPGRCILLSRGRKIHLPTAELQPNNRKILAVLSATRRYLQTLQAKRYLFQADRCSAQNSWKQLVSWCLCRPPRRWQGDLLGCDAWAQNMGRRIVLCT